MTTDQDTADTYQAPADALLNLLMVATGAGTTATTQKTSMTATVP
jgi:hypothetical protein